jgi:hypothetical protein
MPVCCRGAPVIERHLGLETYCFFGERHVGKRVLCIALSAVRIGG